MPVTTCASAGRSAPRRRRHGSAGRRASPPGSPAAADDQFGYWSTVPGRFGWRSSPITSYGEISTIREPATREQRVHGDHQLVVAGVVAGDQALRAQQLHQLQAVELGLAPVLRVRVVEQAELGADPHVFTVQEAGRGRQVVGRDRRDGLSGSTGPAAAAGRPARRRSRVNHSTDEPRMLRSTSASVTSRSTVPEVLADHQRAGRPRLEREHGEHDVGVVVHVGAAVRGLAGRHPPQSPQPGDVVDAQPVRVPQLGPQQVAVGGVAGGVQPVRAPRRQAPVLALLAERVRRRTDVHAHREDVLQRPRRRPPPGPSRRRGRARRAPRPPAPTPRTAASWLLHLVLQPRVERHARTPAPCARRRPRAPPGAAAPRATGSTGPRTARRARRRSRTATGRPPAPVGLGPSGRVPQQLARRPLGRPDPVVLDPVADGVRTQHVHLGADGLVGGAVGVEVGHAQRERRREPPARRGVGRGLHRRHRRDRVQRVEQHGLGPVLAAGPGDELAQVAEVADAPRARGCSA